MEGSRKGDWLSEVPPVKATLKVFDFEKNEESLFLGGVSDFKVAKNGEILAVKIADKLRVLDAKANPKDLSKESKPSKKTGWIALSRVKVEINPPEEWKQMFREAWRLQRDYYWVENMSGIDWEGVFKKYFPLVECVAPRSEFSDLLWELQGELGTSYAYELGEDYKPRSHYRIGFLGADFSYVPSKDAYLIEHVVNGDVWDDNYAPPLKRARVDVEEGMYVVAVNRRKVGKYLSIAQALVDFSDQEVQLTISDKNSKHRNVTVKALSQEFLLRYRGWVEKNREYVHETSEGRGGYIHIPDMMSDGFAEFHRYFLAELNHEGLVVDVRFNSGGAISQLLLEKLARKRLGYNLTRWMGSQPYPSESPYGAVVALTNEHAGSDGDIFSHAFKLVKIGKLIGRRDKRGSQRDESMPTA